MAWPICIPFSRKLRLGLRAVDRRVCGRIDNHIGRVYSDVVTDGTRIRDVEILVTTSQHFHPWGSAAGKDPPHLAPSAGDQGLHGKYSASRNRGAAASFAESTGVTPAASGHETFKSGSF